MRLVLWMVACGGLTPASDGGMGDLAHSVVGAPACTVAEDCPYWFCDCREGAPVNTSHCTYKVCEDAVEACPRACESFGTCWLGTASGGFPGGRDSGESYCHMPDMLAPSGCGDGTSYTDVGKACSVSSGCQSLLCLGEPGSYICTKRCASASECPKGWACVAQGGYSICFIGDTGYTPISSNTGCAQVSFADIGAGCSVGSNCQSAICVGNYCSHRCNSAGDCPSGWSCGQPGNATFYVCQK